MWTSLRHVSIYRTFIQNVSISEPFPAVQMDGGSLMCSLKSVWPLCKPSDSTLMSIKLAYYRWRAPASSDCVNYRDPWEWWTLHQVQSQCKWTDLSVSLSLALAHRFKISLTLSDFLIFFQHCHLKVLTGPTSILNIKHRQRRAIDFKRLRNIML